MAEASGKGEVFVKGCNASVRHVEYFLRCSLVAIIHNDTCTIELFLPGGTFTPGVVGERGSGYEDSQMRIAYPTWKLY